MVQVRKENSFWMATGAPAWALMRCGEGAGAKQAREPWGGGGRGEADPGAAAGVQPHLAELLGQLLHQQLRGAAEAQQQGRAGELLVSLPEQGVVPEGEVLVMLRHQLICGEQRGRAEQGGLRQPASSLRNCPTPYRTASGVCRQSPPIS